MTAEDLYRELPKGILNWYDFEPSAHILLVGENDDAITALLKSKTKNLWHAGVDEVMTDIYIKKHHKDFDYIIVLGQLALVDRPTDWLKAIKTLLKNSGKLLLGMDNRLGLRYFCGDRDPYTQRNFDGIENYRRAANTGGNYIKGRNYAKYEMAHFLEDAGFKKRKCYAVLPNLSLPQLIYSEDVLPKEELNIRLFPRYNTPDTVFLEEQFLYTDIIRSGLFHQMANAYLIECPLEEDFANIASVTLSLDRGKDNAMATIIRDNGLVEKRHLYEEGRHRSEALYNNTQRLKQRGLKVIDVTLTENGARSPYCHGELALKTFIRLAKDNSEEFEKKLDDFIQCIYQSSDHHLEEGEVVLDHGYIDMVPLNCFDQEGEFVFFDQEFCLENYPLKAIIYRVINIIFSSVTDEDTHLTSAYFYKKYGLEAKLEHWNRITTRFIVDLRNLTELSPLLEKHRPNHQAINTNRQKANYSLSAYQKTFMDIFKGLEGKDLVLFGSGNFTARFMAQFKNRWPIAFIVDNNRDRWGDQLEGIPILSPEELRRLDLNKTKVIICIKNYLPIIGQLNHMGVKNYAIYDPNIEYPRTNQVITTSKNTEVKPYKVGYIAGVFDLFHIGHLNLLKKAKAQCKHLIVGVVSDEGVRKFKKVEPFIPAVERIQMLEACKYVDEVVEIPLHFRGARDAYNMYQFDCMFSGSDYEEDPSWLADRDYLRRQGAEMVFLPYTETTSSSQIKAKINQSITPPKVEEEEHGKVR